MKNAEEIFKNEYRKLKEYPDIPHDYGITADDMSRMEDEPEKYARFALYLLTREREEDHVFENADAMDVENAKYWLLELVKENIQNVGYTA